MAQTHARPGRAQPAPELPAPRAPEPSAPRAPERAAPLAASLGAAEPTPPTVTGARRPIAALRRGCAVALFGGLGLLAVAGHYLRHRG
jgi:hypothetical protein